MTESTRYETLLNMQVNHARETATCLSALGACDVVCERCKDYAGKCVQERINKALTDAKTLLTQYGFEVKEK